MTAIIQALSTALLDFAWQGLFTAFLLWIALFILKNRSARARYAASCAALATMAVLPVVTAYLVYTSPAAWQSPSAWAVAAPQMLRTALARPHGAAFDWAGWLTRWAVPVWSFGVLIFSLRLVWAARRVATLRRQSAPPGAAFLTMLAALRERMKLTRPVRLLISAGADCPSVAGWLRPVVLLPAATIAGLTTQQLEAVLAHELAHILRYDHLVNMLQTVVETLLFYHPAVWWVSARIRHERELCCDDLAVAACGDRLCYARALTRLERLRLHAPGMALGSTGGSLLYRIRRIMGEAAQGSAPSKLPGILALSLGLLCLALNMQWARAQQQELPAVASRPPGQAIQGTVVVEATLDATGAVTDARVLSGPPELRKAALLSVLERHFTPDTAGRTRQVSITFQPAVAESIGIGISGGVGGGVAGGVSGGVGDGIAEESELQAPTEQLEQQDGQLNRLNAQLLESDARLSALTKSFRDGNPDIRGLKARLDQLQQERHVLMAQSQNLEDQLRMLQDQHGELAGAAGLAEAQKAQMDAMQERLAELQNGMANLRGPVFAGCRLKSVTVEGLTASRRDELLSRLPVRVGDAMAEDSVDKIEAVARLFDEHAGLSVSVNNKEVEIRIAF